MNEKTINLKRAEIIKSNTELEAERKQILYRKAQLFEALEQCDKELKHKAELIALNNDRFQELGKKLQEVTGIPLVQKR